METKNRLLSSDILILVVVRVFSPQYHHFLSCAKIRFIFRINIYKNHSSKVNKLLISQNDIQCFTFCISCLMLVGCCCCDFFSASNLAVAFQTEYLHNNNDLFLYACVRAACVCECLLPYRCTTFISFHTIKCIYIHILHYVILFLELIFMSHSEKMQTQ